MTLPPGLHERHLSCGGYVRRYLLHVPAAAAQGLRPLVVLLHGAGAEARWMLEESRLDLDAEREGFLLAVPEALPLDPSKPAAFLKNPTWWNDGSPVSRSAQREADDVAFLTALLDELGTRPVFVTGFSNGAAMTFRLAMERGERLSAIAPVAGYCWLAPPASMQPIPTVYLVGKDDPLVPWHGGTVRSPWGWSEERPPVSETIERWRRALGETLFELHILEELGHHWPGGRGLLSRLFGPPRVDVSANEIIWRFFQRSAPRGNQTDDAASDNSKRRFL